MVVEHSFVTTLDAPQALQAASAFLAQRGFVSANTSAFPMTDPTWTSLKMTRGKTTRRARSISELPQSLRLDFDRGRVTLALSITPSAAWGAGSFYSEPKPTSKRLRLHRELLAAIATALESLLAHRAPAPQAAAPWDTVEAEVARVARRRKVRNGVVLASIVLLVLLLIVFPLLAAQYHWFRR
jgi:hypothetical protein